MSSVICYFLKALPFTASEKIIFVESEILDENCIFKCKFRFPVDFSLGVSVCDFLGLDEYYNKVLSRLSTTFLWVAVGVFVCLGGATEPIFAPWGSVFPFYEIFHQTWCACQIW